MEKRKGMYADSFLIKIEIFDKLIEILPYNP